MLPTLMLEVLFRPNLSSIIPNVHPCSPITSIFPKISIVFLNFSHFLQFSSIPSIFLNFPSNFLIFPHISFFLIFPHFSSIFLIVPQFSSFFPQFSSVFPIFFNFSKIFEFFGDFPDSGDFGSWRSIFLGGGLWPNRLGKLAYPLLNPLVKLPSCGTHCPPPGLVAWAWQSSPLPLCSSQPRGCGPRATSQQELALGPMEWMVPVDGLRLGWQQMIRNNNKLLLGC